MTDRSVRPTEGGFMLGLELERAIRDAWLNLQDKILNDPRELHRRLARRRSKSLTRPPRAWCIAIRASDRRITPAHWLISPEHALDLDHPLHPYEPIEHEVTIQTHAIRRYCHPVCFSIEEAVDVAQMLGVSDLRHARRTGQFHVHYVPHLGGKRGHPVPLLSNGKKLLDPGHANFFSPPHPIWGAHWEFLNHLFPDNFEQTVTRRPHFRPLSRTGTPACHPPPPARHPSAPASGADIPVRHPFGPEDFRLRGYRWLCPTCKKPVRTLYYPIPVRTIFDNKTSTQSIPLLNAFPDPVLQQKLSDADLPHTPPPVFACRQCHNIAYFSSIKHDAWNHVISHLTAGLLFGHEVPIPASFIPHRKRTRIRQLNRQSPIREKVLTRLRNSWTDFQIARDLNLTANAVKLHVSRICKQERVPDRRALAQKLQFPAAPPLTVHQRAVARRPAILQMLLRDCTHAEMTKALSIDHPVLQKDILAIYQQHGIKGKPHTARRKLAQKFGVPFVSRREEFALPSDQLRARINDLRQMGTKWKDIARELGVSEGKMSSYRVMFSRARTKALATHSALPTPPQSSLPKIRSGAVCAGAGRSAYRI